MPCPKNWTNEHNKPKLECEKHSFFNAAALKIPLTFYYNRKIEKNQGIWSRKEH